VKETVQMRIPSTKPQRRFYSETCTGLLSESQVVHCSAPSIISQTPDSREACLFYGIWQNKHLHSTCSLHTTV